MRYPLDERVFHYGLAGGACDPNIGVKGGWPQFVGFTTVAEIAAILATTIVLDVGGAHGKGGDGNILLNELKDGYMVAWSAGGVAVNRRIVSNTAVVGGGEMTITVDKPIPIALAVNTDHIELMANPYMNLQSDPVTYNDFNPYLGIPALAAVEGQYLWIQTWGPVWCSPGGTGQIGVANNNRKAVFRNDGSVDAVEETDAITVRNQFAGFVLATAIVPGQGAPFIYLMIAP